MSALPELLPFSPDDCAIPESLRSRSRWAPWAAVWNDKRAKFDKIPRKASHPQLGLSSAKPELWVSFDEAIESYQKYPGVLAGVGYCMTGVHGVIGVDLDRCVNDGVLADWAQSIVQELASYAELSPSGQGVRVMGLGVIDGDWTNHQQGIEIYGGHEARFLTITGRHLAQTPAALCALDPLVLDDIRDRYAAAGSRQKVKSAQVLDLAPPALLETLLLPEVETLALSKKVIAFLTEGKVEGGDRSALVHACGVALYALGLDDATVYSLLAHNPHAMAVALNHRRGDPDRAQRYLWREHCQKAKPKAQRAIVSAHEFDVLQNTQAVAPVFVRDKSGRPIASADNVARALRSPAYCGLWLGFDRFRDEIMFSAPAQGAWQSFTDADYVRLRITLENRGFRPIGRELMRDVVLLVAAESAFDSAIAWLEPLQWDGVPRVEHFFHRYLGAHASPYSSAVSRYLWSALAGRVLEPGVKADMVPILVGAQGVGKSRAVAALAPSLVFFTELSLQDHDDNLSRLMRGRLVAEIGELRGLHTRELESIKAFITRTHENWIPKYREFATQFARRLVFIGTTNKDEFLADETGNRRWLPVKVGLQSLADVQAIERDRLQLWAEGKALFLQGGVHYAQVESLAGDAQQGHTMSDSWAEVVSNWLHEPDALTGKAPYERSHLRLSTVLREALRFEDKQMKRVDEMRVGAVLRGLGYERKKIREGSDAFWAFVPTSSVQITGQEHRWEQNSHRESSLVPTVPTCC
jgi:hypothetical protein